MHKGALELDWDSERSYCRSGKHTEGTGRMMEGTPFDGQFGALNA